MSHDDSKKDATNHSLFVNARGHLKYLTQQQREILFKEYFNDYIEFKEKAIEVIKWYANSENWEPGDARFTNIPALEDEGQRAREVLEAEKDNG
jgi:hypothetical protein